MTDYICRNANCVDLSSMRFRDFPEKPRTGFLPEVEHLAVVEVLLSINVGYVEGSSFQACSAKANLFCVYGSFQIQFYEWLSQRHIAEVVRLLGRINDHYLIVILLNLQIRRNAVIDAY